MSALVTEAQLKQLGPKFRMFGRAEVRELHRIISSDEKIHHCIYGYYQGGSGILVATNRRVLLIDKRPFFLNLEDLAYEKIRDIAFMNQFLQATLHLQAGMKKLSFRSISDARLRRLKEFVEARILEVSQVEATIVNEVNLLSKPYLNQAWRARRTGRMTKRYPKKFYAPTPIAPTDG